MISRFTDLIAWKEAHILTLSVYKLLNKFPKSETFALSDQIRRCSVSVGANIAEGFSRLGKKDKQRFYYIAKGSLTELENHFLIARDLKYLESEEFILLEKKFNTLGRLITGLIRSVI